MKLFEVKAGTKGYVLSPTRIGQYPQAHTVKNDFTAEQGNSYVPGEYWMVDDPIKFHNECRRGQRVKTNTVGDMMIEKGYAAFSTVDAKKCRWVLFVLYSSVKVC